MQLFKEGAKVNLIKRKRKKVILYTFILCLLVLPLLLFINVHAQTDNTLIATIPTIVEPGYHNLQPGFAVDQKNNTVFLINYNAKTLTVVNATTNLILDTITLSYSPDGIAYDPTNNYVYVAQYNANVTVIDASNYTKVGVIGLPSVGDEVIAYDPASKVMYVGSFDLQTNDIFVVNGTTLLSTTSAGGEIPIKFVFDKENGDMYALLRCPCSIPQVSYVMIFNSQNTLIGMPSVGYESNDIGYNPIYNNIYVSNYESAASPNYGDITVISGYNNIATANVTLGSSTLPYFPDQMAIDVANGNAYVMPLEGANVIDVVSGATNSIIANITIPLNQNGLLLNSLGYSGDIFYSPANAEIYVSAYYSSSSTTSTLELVYVIDPSTNSIITSINIGSAIAYSFGYNPSTGDLYACGGSPTAVIFTGVPLSLSFDPPSVNVKEGSTVSSTLTVTAEAQKVSLSVSSLPTGVSGSWSSNTVTASTSGVSDTLELETSIVTRPGTYDIKVIATSAYGETRSITLVMSVYGYKVKFTESGLPSGTTWGATLKKKTIFNASSTIEFDNVSYGFYNWNVSSLIQSGTTRYIMNPSSGLFGLQSDYQLSIAYETQYEVTFEASPARSGTISPVVGTTWENAAVSFPISTQNNSGYGFVSWSTSSSSIAIVNPSSKQTAAQANAPGTIYANFYSSVSDGFSPSSTAVVQQGSSISTNVIVYGGAQAIVFSVEGLPSGTTFSFGSIPPITDSVSGVSDNLKISTSSSTPTGNYPVIVYANGYNGHSGSAVFNLTVIPPMEGEAEISSGQGGPILFSSSAGAFLNLTMIPQQNIPFFGRPPGLAFPFGLSSWTLAGLAPGQTIQMQITFEAVSSLPKNVQYWKEINGQWTNLTSQIVSVNGNNLALSITDGGVGDSDGSVNGQISDPGGIAFPVVLSTSTNSLTPEPTVVGTISVASGCSSPTPDNVAVDSANGNVYVGNCDSGTVSVISSATNSVISTIALSQGGGNVGPIALSFDSSNGNIYATEPYNSAVAIISGTSNTIINTVQVGFNSNPAAIAVDSSTGSVYVAGDFSNIYVLSPSSSPSVSTIYYSWTNGFPQSMTYDPLNGDIYIVSSSNGAQPGVVTIIDTSTNQPLGNTITVGPEAEGITFDPSNGNLYVANSFSDTVSIIDGVTNKVTDTLSMALNNPNALLTGVAFNPVDGGIYVTSLGGDTVTIINGSTNQITNTVAVGIAQRPIDIAFDPMDNGMYVSYSGPSTVSVIEDKTSTTSISTISVGNIPGGVTIDLSNGGELYVGVTGANAVSILNTSSTHETVSPVSTIGVGDNPAQAAYDSSNGYVYVTNQGDGTISVIDTLTDSVVDTINIGQFVSPQDILYDAPNGLLYVAVSSGIDVVNPSTSTIVNSFYLGFEPSGIALDPSSGNMYVGNPSAGTISEFDPVTNSVVNTISIPGSQFDLATYLAFDSQNGYLYVSNNPAGTVAIIDTGTDAVISSIPISNMPGPGPIAFDPSNGYVYVATVGSTYNLSNVTIISGTEVLSTIQLDYGLSPSAIVLDQANGNLYITSSSDQRVIVVSTETDSVSGTLIAGQYAVGITLDGSAGNLYVVNSNYDTVSVFNASINSGSAPLQVGNFEAGSSVYDPLNGMVYVANGVLSTNGAGGVFEINGLTNKPIGYISLPCGGSANALALDSSNGYLYVVGGCQGQVEVIDTSTNNPVTTINIGNPFSLLDAITYDPSNGNIYVADGSSGSSAIYVIDGATNSITSVVNGVSPYSTPAALAFDPLDGYVYSANRAGNSVYVISGEFVLSTINVGAQPFGASFDSVTGNVYISDFGAGNVSVIQGTSLVNTISLGSGSSPIQITTDPSTGNIYVASENSYYISMIPVIPTVILQQQTPPSVGQFQITFDQSGSGNAPIVDYTFSNGTSGSGVAPFTINVDAFPESSISYTYETTVPSTNTQYVLNDVNPSSPQLANRSFSVVGSYTTQYLVTFTQSGLDSSASGTVLKVNGTALGYSSLPYSRYVNAGTTFDFVYSNPVVSTNVGEQFVLTGVSGNTTDTTFVAKGPATVTGTYLPSQSSTTTTTATQSTTTSSTITTTSISPSSSCSFFTTKQSGTGYTYCVEIVSTTGVIPPTYADASHLLHVVLSTNPDQNEYTIIVTPISCLGCSPKAPSEVQVLGWAGDNVFCKARTATTCSPNGPWVGNLNASVQAGIACNTAPLKISFGHGSGSTAVIFEAGVGGDCSTFQGSDTTMFPLILFGGLLLVSVGTPIFFLRRNKIERYVSRSV